MRHLRRFTSTPWLLALILAVAVPPAVRAVDVPRWAVYETSLTSVGTFTTKAAYTTITVTATFTDPNSVQHTVQGFLYSSDAPLGTGHVTYRIRYNMNIRGTWTYTVAASNGDAGLTVSTPVSVRCVAAAAPPGGVTPHGFLRRDASFPYSFIWDDGARPFLWGQTYYQIVNQARGQVGACPLPVPASDTCPWRTAVKNSAGFGMNKVRMLISPWSKDPRYAETQPFPRVSGTLDHDDLDLVHWQSLDAAVQYMNTQDIASEIILFRDPLLPQGVQCPCTTCESFFGTLPQDQRYVRYAMARYAAYPNVMWSLSNEWQCTLQPTSYWDDMGCLIRGGCGGYGASADPWFSEGSNLRPLSIHPQPALCYGFFGKPWPVNAVLQYTNVGKGDQWGYNSISCNRQAVATCPPTSGKDQLPVVNDEYGYLGKITNQDTHRNAIWGIATGGGFGSAGDARATCLTGGSCTAACPNTACTVSPIQSTQWADTSAAPSTNGGEYADLQRMTSFFVNNAIPFWNMAPQTACQDTGRVYVLAEPATVTTRQYVIYDAVGGTVTVPVGNGTYTQVWYNPRTGATTAKPNLVVTTGSASFAFGGFNDWVAWLKKI